MSEWDAWCEIKEIKGSSSPKSEISSLILSSGGVHGILQLGALFYLEELLTNVTKYYGCSVGAINSFLLIIGYSPISILSYLKKNPISIIPDISTLTSKYGVFDWDEVIGIHLRDMMKKKEIKENITMEELSNIFKKELTVVTYNQTLSRLEYISSKNNPTLQCIDALRMTSNIPIVFQQCKIKMEDKEYVYLDGALGDSYPLKYARKDSNGKILGLDIHEKTIPPASFLETLYNIPCISMKLLKELRNENELSETCSIVLEAEPVGHFSFNMTSDQMEKMFVDGVNQAKKSYTKPITSLMW